MRPQIFPQFQALLLQRRGTGAAFPHIHDTLTIFGHGGHGPNTQKKKKIINIFRQFRFIIIVSECVCVYLDGIEEGSDVHMEV